MQPNSNRIRQFASSPEAFRSSLIIQSQHGRSRLGKVIADFQRDDFAALDPAFIAIRRNKRPPLTRYWIERVKGASKTSDIAVQLLWLIAFGRGGLLMQAAAKDSDQAGEIKKSIRDILRANEWLQQRIEVQRSKVLNNTTDSQLEILSADEHGSHGARPDVLFIDEIVHVLNRDFIETLMDNAAKTDALTIIATNAGFVPSWQYDLREMARESAAWHFSQVTTPAPWISETAVEERRLSTSQNRFDRLWRGQWVADQGDALQTEDIEAAVTLKRPLRTNDPDFRYHKFAAGIDIGLRKDATAFVVVGRHVGGTDIVESETEATYDEWLNPVPVREYERTEPTHRFRLVHVKLWKPSPGKRVSLEAVRRHVWQTHKRLRLAAVAVDPHQAEHLCELLKVDRVPVQLTPQTGPSLNAQATSLVEAFQTRSIDLYPDDDVLADLRRLQVAERSYGVRLVSPRTSNDGEGTAHGDAATALSIALRAASDVAGRTKHNLSDWAAVI